MPRIVLARNLQHEQVVFPEGTPHPTGRHGGGSGSLHLRRGSMRDVTPEELAFIKAERPEVYKCLDVLPEPKLSPALARKVASQKRQAARAAKSTSKSGGASKPLPRAKKTKEA